MEEVFGQRYRRSSYDEACKQWVSHELPNGATLYTTDVEVWFHTLVPIIKTVLDKNDGRDLYVLHGVHGREDGKNWINIEDDFGKKVHVIPFKHWEKVEYLFDEIDYYDNMFDDYRPVHFIDISSFTSEEFQNTILNKNANVIVYFCYSNKDIFIAIKICCMRICLYTIIISK